VVALLGRNGAGKSTLLKALMGLVARFSGEVLFDGRHIELVNPTIVRVDGSQTDLEGCLSVAGFYAPTTRGDHASVRAFDRRGRPIRVAGRGLLARALQHELDHLDGRIYLDRLESLDALQRVGPDGELVDV